MPEKREFLIRGDDGKEYGPAGLEELREWVRENRAGLGSFVRPDEPHADWKPWQYYPELVALAAEAKARGAASGMEGLTIAPLPKRVLAGIVDVLLSNIIASPILYVVMSLSGMPDWQNQLMQLYLQPQNPIPDALYPYLEISNLVIYAVLTLYLAGFHARHGQTPAKALLHLRVVGPDGNKPPFARSLLRGFIFSLSVCPFYSMPLLLCVLFNARRRAFHDYAANTCVVEA
ncbi:MAG TPA: RDD family protein [Candidatus Methylacidiphilales bacterium]|nr:RDD family protein [Candidatus Methylacidiphilales bacterium]